MDQQGSGEICQSCGSSNVIDDDNHFESHRVCTDCGTLATSSGHFDWTGGALSGAAGTSAAVHPRHTLPISAGRSLPREPGERPAPSRIHREALARLKNMAVAHNLTRSMRESAIDLFERAYVHSAFNGRPREAKILLAGCCVYVVARQNDWPISLYYVASFLRVHPYQLNDTFKRLLATFQLIIPSPDIEDLVESFVSDLPDKVVNADRGRLVDVMRRTLRLSRLVQLSTGVAYRPLLECVAFVAWRHLLATTPGARRQPRNETFKHFSDVCSFVSVSTTRKRLSEINEMLENLRDRIPWISPAQRSRKNLYSHLDSILSYSHALIKTSGGGDELSSSSVAVETQDTGSSESENGAEDGICSGTVDTNTVDTANFNSAIRVDSNSGCSSVDSSSIARVDSSAACTATSSSVDSIDSSVVGIDTLDSNDVDTVNSSSINVESTVSEQPVDGLYYRYKKRKWPTDRGENCDAELCNRSEASLNSTELTSEDLLDSELHKYIRSPAEARFFYELEKRLRDDTKEA